MYSFQAALQVSLHFNKVANMAPTIIISLETMPFGTGCTRYSCLDLFLQQVSRKVESKKNLIIKPIFYAIISQKALRERQLYVIFLLKVCSSSRQSNCNSININIILVNSSILMLSIFLKKKLNTAFSNYDLNRHDPK